MQKDQWREKTMEQTTQVVQKKSISASRRNQIRYPLRTPVVYKWQDATGLQRRARGWTRDISEAGAYVLSDRCPVKGESVELTFKLLGLGRQHNSRNRHNLAMGGEVVRVDFAEMAGAAVGFAVRSKTPSPNKQTDDPLERIWVDGLALSAVCN
ncbi:MAG TPA: PilZ domain-containing protein [Candidatus Acidoferrum sp.]|nr:PilZ domain-containing protein [Candidatus Acidoferrum sp.]